MRAAPRPPAGASIGRLVLPVVLGLAVLQALWILTVPPFRASDEFDHVYRAAAVARGEWLVTDAAPEGRGLLVSVPPDIVAAAHDQCTEVAYTGPDNCRAADTGEGGLVRVASGAGTYHPAFYWVVGTAARPFSGTAALYAMRIAAALLCLGFLALAACAVATWRRPRWGLTGLVVAATPVLLFSTAVPAPNGLEMSAAMAFWASLLALGDRAPGHGSSTRWLLVVAGLSGAVLGTLRQLGPLFVVLIVVVCLLVARRGAVGELWRRHRARLVAAGTLVGAAVVGSLAWVAASGSGAPAGGDHKSDWGIGTVVVWALQTIAAFPYRNVPAPAFVYPAVIVVFVLLVAAALRLGARRERVGVSLAVLGALLLPVALTLATQQSQGVIWQGRYGLPFDVGAVLVAAHVISRRARRPGPSLQLLPIAAVLAAAYAACFVKVVHDELDVAVSAQDPAWLHPSAWLLVAGSVLAWGLLAAGLAGRPDRGGPPSPSYSSPRENAASRS